MLQRIVSYHGPMINAFTFQVPCQSPFSSGLLYNDYVVYIFDFDGTICDSLDVVVETANKYLTKKGKTRISVNDIRTKGIERLLREYKLTKLQILMFVLKGRHEFKKFASQLKVFPELLPILQKLSTSNTLAILSTNSKQNIKKFLETNKISDLFIFVENNPFLFNKAGSLKKIMRKYKFNPNETFYIGDELRDLKAGRVAGIKSVGVTWGYEGKELLKIANPDFLVDSPIKLLTI